MNAACPVSFDIESLRNQVAATYTRVAEAPDGDFHFHRGADYAVRQLHYDAVELAQLPSLATMRFAGVGNPLRILDTEADSYVFGEGDVVLDHACGAGTDLLLAARRVGPQGRVIGVDMTSAMREVARRAAQEAGLADRVEIRGGLFEALPVASESVDVVISNGVINLAPDKVRVFREIRRVLKPGGVLLLADVMVARPVRGEARNNPALWAACIGGAMTPQQMFRDAIDAGLRDMRVVERFDCFRGTSAEARVSRDLQVHSANIIARR